MLILKRIDILINGAAGNFLSFADKLSYNAFKTVLEIDTLATFWISNRIFNKWFKHNKGGIIINISASLHYLGTLMQVHASAAKAAVDAITRVLALDWGKYGVRVNGVAPGIIEGTVGFEKLSSPKNAKEKKNNKTSSDSSDFKSDTTQNMLKNLTDYVPLDRLGNRKDVSNCSLFLASEASSYMTGQTLLIDGGQLAIIPNGMVNFPGFIESWKPKF